MEKKRRTIRIDDDTWSELEKLAAKRGTSVSKIVNNLVGVELTMARWYEWKRDQAAADE